MKFDSEAARRKRLGVEATGLSKRREDLNRGLEWVEIPLDKIRQADLRHLIATWDEFCLRLWGMRPYVDPKAADTQRWTDACAMKLTCRRLAEHAEKELGDGTALLQISGLLPAAQPAVNEWDAAWAVVRRLKIRHVPQSGREETGLAGGRNKRPAYSRDHLWLKWSEEDKIGPAKIRDRWDVLPDSERKAVCSNCWEKIGDVDKDAGRETVKTALGKAKRENK